MNAAFEEPTIPPWLRRPLAALWISLGLHTALIALVQVAPPAASRAGEMVIQARLVPTHVAPAAAAASPAVSVSEKPEQTPQKVPLLVPSKAEEAPPVAQPVAAPAPAPAESLPASVAAPPMAAAVPPAATVAPASTPPVAAPAPLTITSAVDLTYYSARDVDVHPRALHEIVPDYPEDADRQRLSGKVRLQLKLEADGRVIDIEVVSASPPEVFNESAVKAFRDARFAPAQKNGRPVRALVQIEVVYDWEGRQR